MIACPSYLTCLAIGEFVSFDDGDVHGISLKYFALKGTPESQLKVTFGRSPDIMRFLEEKLGTPFPYPKYYQVVTPTILSKRNFT